MDVENRIIAWVQERHEEMKGETVDVAPDSDLLSSGLLDSLDFLQLMTFLEAEFSVEIPIDKLTPDYFSTPLVAAELIKSLSVDG